MKRSLFLIVLVISGLAYFSSVVASQEGQEGDQAVTPSGEEIVAMCEDKYSSENYSDEDERNNLIDKCINEGIDGSKSSVEES